MQVIETKRWLAGFVGHVLARVSPDSASAPLFVFGAQRSGTTLFLQVLDKCPDIDVFHEGDRLAFDSHWRIRGNGRIRYILNRCASPVAVFKPLNDSQHCRKLMAAFPRSKAVWIYRHYSDVVSSSVKLFDSNALEIVGEVCKGKYTSKTRSAYGENVGPAALKVLRDIYSDDWNLEDGAAMLWYLRNATYFSDGLNELPSMMICKYEDLVSDPKAHFRRVFDMLELPFDDDYVSSVHSNSVAKKQTWQLDPAVETVCDDMFRKLDTAYDLQVGAPKPASSIQAVSPG